MSATGRPLNKNLVTKLLVAGGLLVLCFGVIDFGTFVATLRDVSAWHFFGAFVLSFFGTVVSKAWISYLTTRTTGLSVPLIEFIRINLVARFYTVVFPRGVATAVRWHQYSQGGSGHAAAALVVFENVVFVLTICAVALVGLSLESRALGSVPQIIVPLAWLGAVGMLAALFPFLHNRTAKALSRLLSGTCRRGGRTGSLVAGFLDALASYQSMKIRDVCLIVLASALGYAVFVLGAWVLATGMSLGVSLIAVAWVRSVTLLVALLPVTVGGMGLREGALILLLREYGVAPGTAFAYAIASLIIQLLLGIIGALTEVIRVMRDRRVTDRIVRKSRKDLP